MAANGRWTAGSLEALLYQQSYRFDFYQAVRLLELLSPDPEAVSPGDGARPEREVVRFSSEVDFSFSGSDLAGFDGHSGTPGDGDYVPPRMRVNFMGLGGAQGPLPAPFTQILLDRLQDGDPVMRDFLDIFNHRLVSLMYRVRRTHRLGFAPLPPGQDAFASYLYAIMGLGTADLSNRLAVPDASLLRYAGLLAHYPRSAVGLQCLLADYFHTGVEVRQFAGRWVCLDAEDRTAIGASGRNQLLGAGLVLGRRVRDLRGKLEIRVGPLDLQPFLDFLPGAAAFEALRSLTDFYLQGTLVCDLRLTLKAAQVPGLRLDGKSGSRLGWTSWLKTQHWRGDGQNPEIDLAVIEK